MSMSLVCGIYKITNTINNKSYIGQSINIHTRYNHHFSESNNSRLHMAIAKAVRKYGKEYFSFDILENCDREHLDERERYYVELYNTVAPSGYNLRSGGNIKGCTFSEEAKANMSKARTGMKLSDSARANIAKASGRRKHTDETKEKLRQLNIGRKFSDETKKLQSEKAKLRQPFSAETRQKLSIANKGKAHPSLGQAVERSDGKIYVSASEAGRELGVVPRSVSNVIATGARIKGYTFKKIKETDYVNVK